MTFAIKMISDNTYELLNNKVGHLLLELGFDLKTSHTLLITLLSKIRQRKFDTTIPTVDDQP